LRGTAGLGVVLMLVTLYRPVFAIVPGARGPTLPPATRASAPVAAAKPPGDRVRGAIVPTALRIEKIPGGGELAGRPDPWALFDGDGAIPFETAESVRVRVWLPGSVALEAIGIYGAVTGVVSVYADTPSGAKAIGGLERLALADLPLRWNRFEATSPLEAASVILEITPAPGTRAEVREVELWGKTPVTTPKDLSAPPALAESLLTELPVGAVQVSAEPASALVSAPRLGPDGGATFSVTLDRPGRTFERAFLVYELEGLAHWSGARRRVNGQQAQGGFHADHTARGGLQVEEISPAWLRAGRNEVQFLVANRNDPMGYQVKQLRIVGVPAAGGGGAYLPAAASGGAVRQLFDGKPETGLAAKDLAHGGQVVDLRFPGPSQPDSLLVSVEKGAKGTIAVEPIVKGKLGGHGATADLSKLAPGWNRIALDATPTEAEGVRIAFKGGDGEASGALVSELRVTGSRRPNPHASGLVVTYPMHGECVDGAAYVRGFLRADGTGSVKGAALRVDGTLRPDALAADGAFAAVIQPPPNALRTGEKWQVELEATFANGDSTGGMVDVEGCQTPPVASQNGPVEDAGAPFGQWVKAGQAVKLSFSGATLDIPAGALANDTRITIRPISGIEVPATDETLTNVTPGGRAYRLGPHGLAFAKAVSLTVPYDRDRFVGGQAEDDLGAFFFDEEAKRWRQVQTVRGDSNAQTLTAATGHFTDFISATISTPDHPTADSFNPNSIKDIKAADPSAKIDLIAPPEPSPDGAVHVSFPIWIPPGRQGMQPVLSAAYSSDAGNSILGMGWDLPISSVQVDTRFGVPRYDSASESETYTLDGELLVIDANQQTRASHTTFHRRTEGRFDTIIRKGNGPIETSDTASYSWEVIDKKGIHFFYGESFGARGSITGRGTYRWYLEREEDAFGNEVLYKYDKRLTSFHGITSVPSVEVYPKEIDYTADSTGANAAYRLLFEMDDGDVIQTTDTNDKTPRPDPFSNARGGTIALTGHRLVNIRLFQGTSSTSPFDAFRRYNFRYKTGEFDKTLLDAIAVVHGETVLFTDTADVATFEFYRHTFNYSSMNAAETPQTAGASFETPQIWGQVDSNQGMSATSSESLNGTAMIGAGPIGCELFHVVAGGAASLDLPIPIPDRFPHDNQDRTIGEFVDVNGDGLPDFIGKGANFQGGGISEGSSHVFLNGGNILIGSSNPQSFVDTSSVALPSSPLQHGSDFSVSVTFGAHELFETAHQSFEETWASNTEDKVLADIDGDGFVDLLSNNGSFILNHGQGFSSSASSWAMPTVPGMMPQRILDQQKAKYTLTDPTLLWTAPFTGHVRITGAAQKAPNAHPGSDGVALSIEAFTTNGTISTETSSWSRVLGDSTLCTPSDTNAVCGNGRTVFVRQGDRVYLRADSIDDIEDDTLAWNPLISYVDIGCDNNGNNCQTVTAGQRALREPFGTGAFDFDEVGDFRLAGRPFPLWRADTACNSTIRLHGNLVKHATSDAVTVQILRYPGRTNPVPAPTVILQNALPAMPLGAAVDQTFPIDTTLTVSPGDRLFFRISSSTPVDPNQVFLQVQSPTNPTQLIQSLGVDYVTYCRTDSIPPETTSSDPAALQGAISQATTVSGTIIGCTSAPGSGACQIQGDPDPNSNPISSNVVFQTTPSYYQESPWLQQSPPVGFVAPSTGQVTLTSGLYAGPGSRLIVRRSNETLFDTTVGPSVRGAILVPTAPASFQVAAGDSLAFDAFTTVVPPAICTAASSASWSVAFQFSGTGQTQTITARPNCMSTASDADGGHFHGWTYFEWNGSSPTAEANFDARAQLLLSNARADNNNQAPPDARVMAEAPLGLTAGPGNDPPAVAGPAWRGGGADDYIGAGSLKPSRLGRPRTDLPGLAFSATANDTTAFGGGFIFGVSDSNGTSSTQAQLIDMNGDRFPDLVTNTGIHFNHVTNPSLPSASGSFDPNQPTELSLGGGNLRDVDTNNVSATLGISSPVTVAKKGKPPKWASLLPAIGIGYGDASTKAELLDINGDGLPDYVTRDPVQGTFSVRINLGYELAAAVPFGGEGFGQVTQGPNVSGSGLATGVSGDFLSQVDAQVGKVPNALQKQDSAMNNIGAGYSYFGGNRTAAVSRTIVDTIDVNGDGLPDIVQRRHGSPTMSIWFNTGDGFAAQVDWQMPPWPVPLEQSFTAGLGSNDALAFSESLGLGLSAGYAQYFETGIAGCYGFEIGAGAGTTTTGSQMRFEDIDGDGAPDQVLKLAGNPNVYVRRNPAGGSPVLGVNLLRQVINPLGGVTALTYARIGHVVDPNNHIDMPEHQFALAEIITNDGNFSFPGRGLNLLVTTVDYSQTPSDRPQFPSQEPTGFYSRAEREFLGYSHLIIRRFDDTRQIDRTYDNSTYQRRHLLLTETTHDSSTGTPRLFRKTTRTFDPRLVAVAPGAVFPALTREQTFFYEGLTNDENAPIKTTTLGYDYDDQGNRTKFDDLGDDAPAVTSDDLHYSIGFQLIPDPIDSASGARLVRANDLLVRDAAGNLLRERVGVYGPRGEMQQMSDKLFGGKHPTTGTPYTFGEGATILWSFTYDGFGNVQHAFDPSLYELDYTYDPVAQTHVATVTDSFGYHSSRTYDMHFGAVQDTTDVNGQKQHIDYDLFGRMVSFFAPQDIGSTSPTITMDYAIAHDRSGVHAPFPFWARTKHKDAARATDTLNTVVFVDGMDRVRQTKKDATVGGVEGRILSGAVTFDDIGRVFQEGFPSFEVGSAPETTFNGFPFGRATKSYAYDVLDRVRAVQRPDDKGTSTDPQGQPATTTLVDYNAKALDGRTQLVRTTQDPLGKLRTEYLSPRGEVLAVSEMNRIGTAFPNGASTVLTTRYTYDALSELRQIQDPSGNLTTADYDSFGHMVRLLSPDAGQTEWRYDTANRLAAKETANLRANGKLVTYAYDFDRLKAITYPTSTSVAYIYGGPTETSDANGNVAGRIKQIQDESGTESRRYDALGNVSHMEKLPKTQLPSIPSVLYKMDYAYDAFGRALTMGYPDGEQLKYFYDSGGLVTRVDGTRDSTTRSYATNVAYDELERRVSLTLFDGSATTYTYYPDTKRLKEVDTTIHPVGATTTTSLQKLQYTYDLVGNVTQLVNGIDNPTPVPPNTVIAPGPNTQNFVYDDLYQLASASGRYVGCACGCANDRQYTLTMQYDGLGNIKQKTQNDVIEAPANSGKFTTQLATTYNNAYTYGPQPHAPTGIGPETLTYDVDGNTVTANGTFGPSRTFTWSEDDRLRSETDSGFTSTFLYDASGTRSHKRRTTLETWYVNAYYVVKNSLTETKHVFLGSDRIASEVATISNRADPTTAGAATLFLYHPDHLQSTQFTTGADGSILQHDEYFPSGEVWFQEQKNNDARNTQPWLFNAKELDETGLYYFGARYYNPKYSTWASTDPELGSYMQRGPAGAAPKNLGLYTYAWNNPVIMRDPDGRQTVPAFEYVEPYETDRSPFERTREMLEEREPGGTRFDFRIPEGARLNRPSIEAETIGPARGFETPMSITPPEARGPGRNAEENNQMMSLPNDALVCRGGTCTAERFEKGSGVSLDAEGRLQSVSVQSRPGATFEELTQAIPHPQVGVSTVGAVREAGGNVVPSARRGNPHHATLQGITPKQAERLFTPTRPNPHSER
jgi:RHS repeat-associated protein